MIRSLFVSLLLTIPAAANWTQFRGPHSSGVAGGAKPPVTFDGASSIAWKTALPGRGLSSPIIIGDKVFVTAAGGPKQETLHVLCFSATDGKPIWEREFRATGRTMCHPKTCNAAPTPCTDGKRLFALFSSNDLLCLDLDGNLLWLRGLMVDYPNAANSLGLASSPVLADGVLVVQMENDSDSFVAGLDTATGVNQWKIAGPKDANWTSPAIVREAGQPDTVVISSRDGALALDPKTGRERWKLPAPGSTIPSCTASLTHLAQPRPGKGMALWELKGGTTPPVMVWESTQVGADTCSPVFIGERVYSINGAGVVVCAETKANERPWKLRLENKGRPGKFSGSPVAAGASLYIASEDGTLYAVDTTAKEGAISGRLELSDTILCTPSIAGNSIYLRSDGALWKIGSSQVLSRMESSHHQNRRRLADLLPAGSLAVIATGPYPVPCGVDSAAPWPDFFYLTGLREPRCALILSSAQTILFMPEHDDRAELWGGAVGGGNAVEDIRPITEFETVLRALAHQAGAIFVFAAENPFAPQEDGGLAQRVRQWLPLHTLDRLAPLLGRLRAGKQPSEIENLRAANELAARGFRRAIGFVRPGVRGFEVKAEFLHEVMRQGSAGFCCPALTAAGRETLTLHWRGDRRAWDDGETALLDFTCEWNGMCADVARCIPAGGRFSARYRAVYDGVVRTLHAAMAALRPGRLLAECERDIELSIQSELLRVGLLKSAEVQDPAVPSPALRRHFMHRALHHIGLEVHDPVPAGVPLAAEQVLAVEPAIYVPEEGFGIRLENNVLITADGVENLTRDLPVEAEEIESLMQL